MRLKNIILPLSALLISSIANAQKIDISDAEIKKVGDTVKISFEANMNRRIPTNTILTITPVLSNGAKEQSLPIIVVRGRNRAISEARKADFTTDSLMVDSKPTTPYQVSIPFEKWMAGVSLHLDNMIEACGKRMELSPIVIAENALKLTMPYVEPLFGSDIKATYLNVFQKLVKNCPYMYLAKSAVQTQAGLVVAFDEGVTAVDESYLDNRTSIRKLREAIEFIKSDSNIELIKITVVAGSSPDGTSQHNDNVGRIRVNSLIHYFSDHVDSEVFKGEYIGEDWLGLYHLVKRSDMDYRDQVLSILDNYPTDQGKKDELMSLGWGWPYKYMRDEFFPKLRKGSYLQVFYDMKHNDDFWKIDKSSELIESKDYAKAIEILKEVTPTPYTNNLIGVCYMMLDDILPSRVYLQKAIDGKDIDAPENLELLNYKIANIQYL